MSKPVSQCRSLELTFLRWLGGEAGDDEGQGAVFFIFKKFLLVPHVCLPQRVFKLLALQYDTVV